MVPCHDSVGIERPRLRQLFPSVPFSVHNFIGHDFISRFRRSWFSSHDFISRFRRSGLSGHDFVSVSVGPVSASTTSSFVSVAIENSPKPEKPACHSRLMRCFRSSGLPTAMPCGVRQIRHIGRDPPRLAVWRYWQQRPPIAISANIRSL
jgi:hypothetical protein